MSQKPSRTRSGRRAVRQPSKAPSNPRTRSTPPEGQISEQRRGESTQRRTRGEHASASKVRRKKSPRPKPTGTGFENEGRAKLLHELGVHQVELETQNEELRQARAEVEGGLERYTQLFDFAPIGYASLTAQGTVREINLFGARLLGRARSALVGLPFQFNVVAQDRARFETKMAELIANDGGEACEIKLRQWQASQQFPARLTLTALKGSDVSVLVAFEDITVQKQAESALREADRKKDEFLALVSHELRTPLSVLLMHSQLLQREGMEPKVRRWGRVMERAARAQARLIDDLLDISRIVAGKLTLELDSADLPSIVRTAVEAFSSEAENKDIDLSMHLDAEIPAISGDPSRLYQVVTNVVGNALKFTPKGGRVSVTLSRVGGHARIEVRDTGAGIDPDFLPRVFERFAQGDQSSTRSTGGLGLGLALVQSIVRAHGGTVQAKSEGRGKGSTFVVSLPLVPPPERSATPTKVGGAETRLSGARLLVVEDDPATRSTLTALLAHEGAEVRGAESGRSAMRVLDEFLPEVLVCDIGMPEEDGCRLLERIRSRARSIRALALTAYATDEIRARTLAAGFESHLVKPVDVEQLVTAISSLLPG